LRTCGGMVVCVRVLGRHRGERARARRDVRCAIGCGVQPEIFQRDAFATEGGGDGLR
jgi:hypothetical protein